MNTFIELLATVARFVVGLWPLMFVVLIVGVVKRRNGIGAVLRTSIKALIGAWLFFGILHLIFYFLKMDTFHLLPESVDQKYFLISGLVLFPFVIAIFLEERHHKIKAETIEQMRALSPEDFEILVADTYRAQGHKVEVVGSTGDHGIDLVVHTRRGETWLVQCKKYRGKVGEPIIRDFYGALRAAEADAGAVVTTGTITEQARLWAEGKPLHLYDGEEFLKIMQTTKLKRSLPPEARRKPAVTAPVLTPAPAVVLQPGYATAFAHDMAVASAGVETYEEQDKHPFSNINQPPECPACGVSMVLHTEKRLFRKAKQLYICPNAPSCPETLEI
jgi:HJR/Mrr/RecB family endonuclease